jgi:hypothetical protein
MDTVAGRDATVTAALADFSFACRRNGHSADSDSVTTPLADTAAMPPLLELHVIGSTTQHIPCLIERSPDESRSLTHVDGGSARRDCNGDDRCQLHGYGCGAGLALARRLDRCRAPRRRRSPPPVARHGSNHHVARRPRHSARRQGAPWIRLAAAPWSDPVCPTTSERLVGETSTAATG